MKDRVTAQEDDGYGDYLHDDTQCRTAHLRALDARMRKTCEEIKEAEAERDALMFLLAEVFE